MILEMVNISNRTVEVMLSNGVMIPISPGGKVVNEEVKNINEIRKYFRIKELLNG